MAELIQQQFAGLRLEMDLKLDSAAKEAKTAMEAHSALLDSKLIAFMKAMNKEVSEKGSSSTVDQPPLLPTPGIKHKEDMEVRKWGFYSTH